MDTRHKHAHTHAHTHTNTHTHTKGPSIYNVYKKITFLTSLPPSFPPCPHGPDPRFHPRWTSTHGRHEIDTALLKDRMSDFQFQILLKRPNVGLPNCKN